MNIRCFLILISSVFAMPVLASTDVPNGGPILLNGECERDEWRDSALVAGDAGHALYLKRSERYLFVCITYPDDGYGTLEGYLVTESQQIPLNIHVSAKVGDREWQEEGWPDFEWWNAKGWWSNPVRFNSAEEGETRFLPSPDREIQFDLRHFGSDGWRIMFEVYYGQREDGSYGTVALPVNAAFDDQETWLELAF